MSDEESTRKTVVDEFGKLILRKSTRGNWVEHKRIMVDENDEEHHISLESRGPNRAKTKDYIAALKGGNINLKMNQMNDRMEINGEPITEEKEAITINFMRDIGLRGESKMRDAISEFGYVNRYHPIRDYLRGLEWDGQDYITALLSHFEHSQRSAEIAEIFWRKWLVGAVAKIMEGGQNFMLVLDGPQRVGKSYLARWLCPPELQREYFIEGAVQPDDKDSYIRLMSKWIWEVGELQATTRRSDMEALKDFITTQEVTVRVPYGRHDKTKPAAASLIGTINETGAGFLSDMTGTRRFGIVEVNSIDWSYTSLSIHQIWAQATEMWRRGYEWLLSSDERAKQEELNRNYEMPSTVAELFYMYYDFEPDADPAEANFVPSAEIIGELELHGLKGFQRGNMMELAKIMRREGVTKAKIDNVNGYCGVKKKAQVKVKDNGNIAW